MMLDPLSLVKCSSGVVFITGERDESCEIVFNLKMDSVLKNNPELGQLDTVTVITMIERHFHNEFDRCGLNRVAYRDHYKSTSRSYSGLWKLGYGILISFQFETKTDLYKFKLKHANVYQHFMKSCTHYIHTDDE